MIKILADWLTYNLFSLTAGTHLADSVDYFIYDVVKIFLLMITVIFTVSVIRSYLPPKKIRDLLSHQKKIPSHFLAAFLGMLTPFCSCSAVPLFLGLVEAGVPLGATFTFLVASPMINEVALVLLLGMFGWKIALLYIFSGLVVAIVSGMVIEKLDIQKLVRDYQIKNQATQSAHSTKLTFAFRLKFAWIYTLSILRKVWLYILIGVGLGAGIHGYVPTDLLAQYAGQDNWLAVPIAVLIGIPLYSNAAGIIPLVGVLTEKGVSMGTTLAFMMAVTGLSLPEFIILKKVMNLKLIIIFAGIVGLGIIFTGYLFNWVL